jgi:2-dehydropantoate 2-reductase
LEPIVIGGAGALGSIYGGILTRAGFDVVLLGRGRHADVMRSRGLELRLPDRTEIIPVRVEERAAGRTLILSARLHDTTAVLDQLRAAPRVAISLQNGPTKNDALAARYSDATLVRGVSTLAAELVAPGVVRSAALGATFLDGTEPKADPLAAALVAGGLRVERPEHAASVEWSKVAQVTAIMGVQAVTRRYLHQLFLSEDAAVLLKRMIEEVADLAQHEGVTLGDFPPMLPVGSLARGTQEDAARMLAANGTRLVEASATDRRTSMLQAIEAGRRTELDDIHGELIRRAAAAGTRLPTVESCYRLARVAGVRC